MVTNNETLINATINYVKQVLNGAEAGHDWWHVQRVHRMAKAIATKEGANVLVVELAALLHDIADAKFHQGDEKIGQEMAASFLHQMHVDETIINDVMHVIQHISFRKTFESNQTEISLACKIVSDADKLDAIGAIGIARTFNYGGYKNRAIYDPSVQPQKYSSALTYVNSSSPTINHFYEKLLLIKDMMWTSTGKELAIKRHAFMEQFLKHFYEEWDFTEQELTHNPPTLK
ncbi:MAG: HD domain-containing protein [Bacteroidia bacterium]|jgi:uncharacterized protein|nr:HD domain-containing protein [Bacteroidia bacterium]